MIICSNLVTRRLLSVISEAMNQYYTHKLFVPLKKMPCEYKYLWKELRRWVQYTLLWNDSAVYVEHRNLFSSMPGKLIKLWSLFSLRLDKYVFVAYFAKVSDIMFYKNVQFGLRLETSQIFQVWAQKCFLFLGITRTRNIRA